MRRAWRGFSSLVRGLNCFNKLWKEKPLIWSQCVAAFIVALISQLLGLPLIRSYMYKPFLQGATCQSFNSHLNYLLLSTVSAQPQKHIITVSYPSLTVYQLWSLWQQSENLSDILLSDLRAVKSQNPS